MALPCPSISSRKLSSGALWTKDVSQQATLYPLAISCFTVAKPKPVAAPVTIAILYTFCMVSVRKGRKENDFVCLTRNRIPLDEDSTTLELLIQVRSQFL